MKKKKKQRKLLLPSSPRRLNSATRASKQQVVPPDGHNKQLARVFRNSSSRARHLAYATPHGEKGKLRKPTPPLGAASQQKRYSRAKTYRRMAPKRNNAILAALFYAARAHTLGFLPHRHQLNVCSSTDTERDCGIKETPRRKKKENRYRDVTARSIVGHLDAFQGTIQFLIRYLLQMLPRNNTTRCRYWM